MEIQGDSSRLGLVRTGHGALDHCGEPELARGLDSCLRAVRDPLGDDGDPVGLEQLANGRRCEPDVVFGGQSGSNGSLSTVAVDRGDLRHGACGPAQPLGALRRPAKRLRRRLGVRKGPGLRLRGQDHRDDRLLRPGSHVGDARGDIGRRHLGGGYEEDDDGVDLIVGDDWRKGAGVRLGSRRAEQIDGVGERRLRRHDRGEQRAGLGSEAHELEPGRFAGVRAENPEPACVGDDRDPPSPGQRLGRENRGDVDELLDRSGPDDTGLPEERCDRSLRSRKGGRVRARRLGARARDPALHRENGLSPRDPARQPPELSRVAERLEIQEDDIGRRILFPELEEVVRGHVRLVADRNERRESEPAGLAPLEQRKPEGAALRGEGNSSRWEGPRRKRGVQLWTGDGDSKAVRADEARTVRADTLEEARFALRSFRPYLGESGGDDAERPYALRQRVLHCLEHVLAGQTEDRQVDIPRNLGQRCVTGHACDVFPAAIHGVRLAGEAALDDVAEDKAADRPGSRRGAVDRDSTWREERAERCDDAEMVPRVDGFPVGLRRRDREDDLDDSSLELGGDRESDVLENAEHAQIRGENLRDEALDSRLGGQARKLLDETCPDPVALELVVDRKRCLCARAVAEARPGSERHDPFAGLAGERAHERAPFIPVRV